MTNPKYFWLAKDKQSPSLYKPGFNNSAREFSVIYIRNESTVLQLDGCNEWPLCVKSYMHKAIKYRIYPNETQINLLERTFGCCRKIWNLMLADKIDYYKQYKKKLQTTPAMYKDDFSYLNEVDSLALANVQMHLDQAYNNFYKNKKFNKPKFKSRKKAKKSYTTNNVNGNIVLFDNSIRLPKLGIVKAEIHRLPKEDWKLKSVTVSKSSDGKYYASVLFEFEKEITQVSKYSNNSIGLDYKSDGLYFDSKNNCCDMPHFFRKSQKKLAKQQRKLARKVGSKKNETKSNNWLRQQLKVNKVYTHTANQRKDFLHKKSTEIANQFDIVCVETLDMKAISNKKFKNGKATMDNGYGMFLNMLEYKLADRGKYFVKIGKWFPSSQMCSYCGYKNPETKDLRIRKWTCPQCGTVHDRDLNAAINIETEGLRILRA